MLRRKNIGFITRRSFARTFFMVKDYTCENPAGTKNISKKRIAYISVNTHVVHNIMTLRFSILLLFLVLAIQSYSQVNFGIRRQKLKPTVFNTTKENIFIYEVPNAILCFRQDEIKSFIDNPENKNILVNYGYQAFQDTLAKMVKRIKIKDIYFYYDQRQRDSIFRQQPENILTKKLNEEFYLIGAGLILNGEFMIYSKAKKIFITKGLIAKRQNGYLGEQSLNFYLPDKKEFYSITTRLGE